MSKTKQLKLFIIDYKIKNGGVSPDFREMGDALGGISTSMVKYNLNKLAEAGQIILGPPGQARSIQVPGIKVVWVG